MLRKVSRKTFKILMPVFLAFTVLCSTFSVAMAAEPQPRVAVYACSGSFNEIKSISTGNRELLSKTDEWVGAGNSLTVSFEINASVSNSATLNAIPELLSYGYSSTVSVSASYSHTLNNTSSYARQVARYKMYDRVTYDQYSYIGNGLCYYYPNQTKKVYTGFLLDFI